ncbi:MAG: hypothetical protein H6833_10835 [Planctomycetes bacterium]|nr:hypothetical protein [Planctomycetota bacterium]
MTKRIRHEPPSAARRIIAHLLGILFAIHSTPAQEPPIEPAVRRAFDAAWQRLSEPWRMRVADVQLVRRSTPEVQAGVDLPLATRLLLAGAHAQYVTRAHQIEVFDAALPHGPQWREPPPNATALATFLEDLTDVLELEQPPSPDDPSALLGAWKAFTTRVAVWPEAQRHGVPEDAPLGDPAFLTGFLRAAVDRSLGEEAPPLEQLLLHELAHAVQLVGDDYEERMASWGTVSAWRRADDGRAARGMWGGGFHMEDPIVLIRALFGGTRGDKTIYAPAATARFANAYMRYDLREDFAEAVRLALYEPERLMLLAPEKLLAVNAIGWHANRSRASSGPLLVPAARLLAPGARPQTIDALRRIVAPRDDEPAWAPDVASAVLRAHVDLFAALEPSELPETPNDAPRPNDLPPDVRRAAGTNLGITVHGRLLEPAARSCRDAWETAIRQHDEGVAFKDGIWIVLVDDAHSAERYLDQEVLQERDAFTRVVELRTLWPYVTKVWSSDRREEFARAEMQRHRRAGRPGLAELVARVAQLPVDEAEAAARRSQEPLWLQAELHAAALHATLPGQSEVTAAWLDAVRAVPGNCWGARLRVRLALEALEHVSPARRAMVESIAREEARTALLPGLRERLDHEVRRALAKK